MELFTPQLCLFPQGDDHYLLRSTTLTPNSCYFAGPAREGLPHGHVVTPETQPVILELRHSGQVCAEFIKPVHHQLEVTLGSGKSQVTAFVVLDGKVLGQATARPGDCELPLLPKACFPTEDWLAVDNQMPGAPRALYVSGIVEVPTPGYTAKLEEGASIPVPQQLPLQLIVEKLPGNWPQVVTRLPVRYQQQPYDGAYKTVQVSQGNCEPIIIEIEEAH